MALAIAAVVLATLLATSPDYAMTLDEGMTIDREESLAAWFSWVADPPPGYGIGDAFRPPVIDNGWRFSREEPDGHPPFYALLGLAGWRVARGWVDPLSSYRFGPMALTAATSGLLFLFLSPRYGKLAGLTAALLLVFMPRSFSHAHYAHYDLPVTCLWLLAQAAFLKSLGSRRWVVVFGVLLGLAAGTKFTGWFALVPPVSWTVIYEGIPLCRRLGRHFSMYGGTSGPLEAGTPLRGTRAIVLGTALAALTLYAIQPPWWPAPLAGLQRFLVSNLTREETIPVTALYLGTVYRFSLPWHNTIVLTGVTSPVLVVILGLIGLVSCVARSRTDPAGLIWPLSFGVLMVVRAFPNAPGHDAERLLLPSLASLAVLAGLGLGWAWHRLRARRLAVIAGGLAALTLVECARGIYQTYPYNLSYYNVAVGGLPGAERMGFEPTYYWETLGREFYSWVEDRSRGEVVELDLGFVDVNVVLLRKWGMFPRGVKVHRLDPVARPDFVLQRNRGIYQPYERWLEDHGHPIFTIRRQGVDLLRVYSFEETLQAGRATKGLPGARRAARRPRF